MNRTRLKKNRTEVNDIKHKTHFYIYCVSLSIVYLFLLYISFYSNLDTKRITDIHSF